MSRRNLWVLYITSMVIIITCIVVILMKRKTPEERALEDYYHGMKLYNLRHYDEAIAKFKLAVRLDPDLVDAYYYIALATEERSYEESAGEWERYIEIIKEKGTGKDEGWNEEEVARSHLAWCYYEVGMSTLESEKSGEYLNKFLELAEDIEGMEDRVVEARERLEKIKSGEWGEMNEVALEYYYSGLRYMDEGEYEEAVKKFRLAIDEDPLMIDAQFYLAMTLEELSYEESIRAWERYIELASQRFKPGEEEWSDVEVAQEHLIWVYFKAGMDEKESKKAMNYLEKFIELAEKSEGWGEDIDKAKKVLGGLK